MIKREEYLKVLRDWQDKQIIKVVTGIRRCGKSTLLNLFQSELLEAGVELNQIVSINFEEMEYEDLLDYKKLYSHLKERIIDGKRMYFFLDEIQKVKSYENVVDSLFVKENIDIYITGSNSYLFSGELASNLRGRYIEIPMLPLSFKEFYSLSSKNKEISFNEYLLNGGFPYLIQMNLEKEYHSMYLEGIYNTVLLKDIEERLNRRAKNSGESNATDIALLKSISKYLSSVIGSPISLRGIANYLISNERKISPNTVSDYVSALCDAYLYYGVEPMDIVGKELLKSNKKYYIVDLGIRNYILPKKEYDLGFLIENVVYFELLRRGYEVNIGKNGSTEIDFIAKKNNEYTYIQVTASMLEESTFNREMKPLKSILTLDNFTVGNYEGIKVINVIDWLLEV